MEQFVSLKTDFPLLKKYINGYPIAYLDNAATSLKPQVVIDALVNYYSNCSGTTFRGVYTIGEQATTLYENARLTVARFIGSKPNEIVFTKGATEGINAVAAAWGYAHISAGDEILITALEHHANILPWSSLAQQVGAKLKVLPVDHDGNLRIDVLPQFMGAKTKFVAVCHVNNVLGIRNDVKHITRCARDCGAHVLIDAAQSVPHEKIAVRDLDCDFLVFSGHKMMGPTGLGVLFCAERNHDQLSPYQHGGGMVNKVDLCSSTYVPMPHLLEAGTPPIAAAIGLACAIDYLNATIDFELLRNHETCLIKRLIEGLETIKKVKINGPLDQLKICSHVVNFSIDGIHPHDAATLCDQYGICLRAGLHCAQPLAQYLNIGPTLRASVYAYNTTSDIDRLLECIEILVS